MLDILIDELTDPNKLIIIDEAQHLTERSFNTLRALNDSAKIGLIYAGTPDIFSRMYGRHEAEYDTIHSRIGYICKLKNRYTEEDIICPRSRVNPCTAKNGLSCLKHNSPNYFIFQKCFSCRYSFTEPFTRPL